MDINNHVVICGDSFCTSTLDVRTHFSQVLEDRFGYTVTSLARSSMSATGICFQIQKAITLRPRAIVYAVTGPARIDVPVGSPFKPEIGLQNYVYQFPRETAYGNPLVGDLSSPILSHNIATWADIDDDTINACLPRAVDLQIRQAVKMYVAYLYDEQLKKETESWMYAHWHREIESHGIMAIRFARDTFAGIAYEFSDAHPQYPMGYHTDAETQIRLAEHVDRIIANAS